MVRTVVAFGPHGESGARQVTTRPGQRGPGPARHSPEGTGPAGENQPGTGQAGTGLAAASPVGESQPGTGQADTGPADTGQAGTGTAAAGPAALGQPGTGSAGMAAGSGSLAGGGCDAAAAGVAAADVAVVAVQLGRTPRGVLGVAHRCPCGLPDVVETAPRLPDGTPFPTLYYLTCPRATAAMSRLEAAGLMREMTRRLAEDPGLRQAQLSAHEDYLARRDAAARTAGVRPLPPGAASAGGMPDRVKCLHALAAHELAVKGANPLGREAVQAAGRWWRAGRCVPAPDAAFPAASTRE
jgi:hypothetical protein